MARPLASTSDKPLAGLIILAAVWAFFSCRTEPFIRTIDAETLADKYSVSVEAARREFDGNNLLVEGYVVSFVSMPKNDDGEGMVLLGSEKSDVRGVECWFTRYESAEFAGLAPGNVITVKGTFNGESGPMLKFCKLVKRPAGNGTTGR